jgi:hypothetical protein
MMAACRELLMMEGILDSSTLCIRNEVALKSTSLMELLSETPTSTSIPKVVMVDSGGKRKVGDYAMNGEQGNRCKKRRTIPSRWSGERLASLIVEQSLRGRPPNDATRIRNVDRRDSLGLVSDCESTTPRLPSSTSTLPATLLTDQTVSVHEVSRFVRFNTTEDESSGEEIHCQVQLLKHDLPAMVEVSIASEAALRNVAAHMTERFTQVFSDKTLRRFLGYRVPSIARPRLVQVLADFLFDTSHALFAYQQTSFEVQSMEERAELNKVSPLASPLAGAIRDMLFDNRALKQIGGWEPTSILPQALSLDWLARQKVTWSAFASTEEAEAMFRHHRTANEELIVQLGQQRRGLRLRKASLWQAGNRGGRSAVVPDVVPVMDKAESGVTSSCKPEHAHIPSCGRLCTSSRDVDFMSVPVTTSVRITRLEGSPWGVRLAQEGNMCVVVRGQPVPHFDDSSDGSVSSNESSSLLQAGDWILKVENPQGRVAVSPVYQSTPSWQINQNGWFQAIAELFKSSCELDVLVRRVQ